MTRLACQTFVFENTKLGTEVFILLKIVKIILDFPPLNAFLECTRLYSLRDDRSGIKHSQKMPSLCEG